MATKNESKNAQPIEFKTVNRNSANWQRQSNISNILRICVEVGLPRRLTGGIVVGEMGLNQVRGLPVWFSFSFWFLIGYECVAVGWINWFEVVSWLIAVIVWKLAADHGLLVGELWPVVVFATMGLWGICRRFTGSSALGWGRVLEGGVKKGKIWG